MIEEPFGWCFVTPTSPGHYCRWCNRPLIVVEKTRTGKSVPIVVCSICDFMDRWPKYR